jgi:hypothetical protein
MNAVKDILNTKKATAALAVALVLTASSFGFAAVAAQPNHEEFHSSGTPESAAAAARIKKATSVPENPLGKQGPMAMMSNQDDPVVRWFENLDRTIYCYAKTQSESAILTRGFNQESDRVQQWTETANKVAVKYRYLASVLRKLEFPPGATDLRDYTNLVADWYADSASIYEDLVKPRKAAKTMEELLEGLDSIHNRAKGLKALNERIYGLDIDLRMKYHVHMREQNDALQKYVKGNPTLEEIKRVGGQLPR